MLDRWQTLRIHEIGPMNDHPGKVLTEPFPERLRRVESVVLRQ